MRCSRYPLYEIETSTLAREVASKNQNGKKLSRYSGADPRDERRARALVRHAAARHGCCAKDRPRRVRQRWIAANGGERRGAHCSSSCTHRVAKLLYHRSYGRSSTTSGRRSRTARRALLGPGSTAATIQIRIQTYRCTPHRTAGVWMWFVFLNLMNITTATVSMRELGGPTRACSAGRRAVPLPISTSRSR